MKILGFVIAVLLLVAGAAGPGRPVAEYAAWWLTNSEPPALALAGPPGGVRGTLEVAVESQPSGRVDLVGSDVDGREIPVASTLRIDTTTLPDGEHTLLVRAQDRSLRRNSADARLQFRSDNTPPTFEVKPNPGTVPQGHTVVIYVQPSEPSDVQVSIGGASVQLFPSGKDYWAVLGVDPDHAAGPQDFVVQGRDEVGNSGQAQGRLEVAAFNFPRDSLRVSQTMLPLLAPEVRADEEERLKTVYRRPNGPPLWKGAFMLPVKGPVSTEFGEVRSYNGGPFQGHHNGTDFQVGMGIPVQAPARGRVALREEVRLRGKTLVLDHGGGVYTTYAHLEDWLVQPGQEVEQGQQVAKVGSTGLSTGPHLHWELWVNGVSVDPLEWTEREVP